MSHGDTKRILNPLLLKLCPNWKIQYPTVEGRAGIALLTFIGIKFYAVFFMGRAVA
jgi:hypothetical protein